MKFKKNKTIYMQIADFICEKILTRKWTEGEKILSVRDLAGDTQVNPNTVMRTYSYLQDQGIIYNKRGIGYFVSEGAANKIQRLKKDNFIQQYLPELFKNMELLGIDFQELQNIYKRRATSN